MGGRGKGYGGSIGSGERGEFVASAQISYNPDRTARPYSIAGAWDASAEGRAPWAVDARGRPRTFATERAASDFVRRNASGPVKIEHFSKDGQHYPTGADGRAKLRPGS
ncbi:hypothetical protein ThidrDRAFT_4586 [Thiorhodococcus drewsii AZ1]|uniref:Uncharacterized protein n=1 Tax=Thiorhodococcus drewsii AZ1 TaxID=765913 RepID=G2E8H2_9GAMM|nr:hypothetical protein [Thiorhodococcus drewsii]EGV27604.1 hypothetical protein ThidrDRAFT_4586 [Thiorhodococcus drewsii AZ1]